MTTYAWPSGSAYQPSGMEWGRLDNDRSTTSGLSGYTQTLSVPGARWQVVMTFPARAQSDRDKLEAFLLKLDGMAHRVSLWDFGAGARTGHPSGTINRTGVTMSSTAAQFATSIVLAGCGANTTLLANSKLSVNGQLLVNVDDGTANGSGVMTLTNTRPMLRAQATAGAAITLIKPTALFVLADPLSMPRSGGGLMAPEFSVRFFEVFL
jgi:hypothetical protein